jgi:cytochrome c oxidase cbb3-type subunit 2
VTRLWLLVTGALATIGFAVIILVVLPQVMLVHVEPSRELKPYTRQERRGRAIYVENGCVYCHSQQVRDPAFTTDVDRGWGRRATVPVDYVYDKPHLLGTMRTGPDLINVGQRLPDPNWHLIHLYNPRAVVPWSIMPAFPFLFAVKDSAALLATDTVVHVQGRAAPPPGRVVVATPEALALVAYLRSLKREYPVPTTAPATQHVGSTAGPAVGNGSHAGRPGMLARSIHTMP